MTEQEQDQNNGQTQGQGQAQGQGQDQSQTQDQDHSQAQNQDQSQTQAQDQSQAQSQDQSQTQDQDQSQAQGQDQSQAQVQDVGGESQHGHEHLGHRPLADELGIEDIYDPMVGKDGKVFCTAGRDAPIAEFTDEVLILHPPQMPLDDSSAGEEFSLHIDERGILLDELGSPKKIPAASYKGCPIFYSGEQMPGTLKHYVVAVSHDGSLHAIFFEDGHRLTSYDVYDLRNRSAGGDLAEFPDVRCDL